MMIISWTYCIVSLHEVYITYFIMDSKWKQETQRVFQRLRCTTYCSHRIGKMKWHMIGATYEFKILREAGCARWRCDKRQILVLSQNSFQIMKYTLGQKPKFCPKITFWQKTEYLNFYAKNRSKINKIFEFSRQKSNISSFDFSILS